MENVKVDIDVRALLEAERSAHAQDVQRLEHRIKTLQGTLKYERDRRQYTEDRLKEAEQQISELTKTKRNRRTKAEMEQARAEKKEYNPYTSKGIKKKTKVDSIRSYTDFKKIQDYFLENGMIRDYAIWTIGTCLGVRASDLLELRWKNIIDENKKFKERIFMYERKTSKLQDCLITEAIRNAAVMLLNSISWRYAPDDYVFATSAKNEPIKRNTVYKTLCRAAENAGVDIHIGTHTMRESFINIVLCVDKSTIDMNAITKAQGLLNHSDPRTTMRYLGTLHKMFDKARTAVSDFVLGKTNVDELVCGDGFNVNDIMDKLSSIERSIAGNS